MNKTSNSPMKKSYGWLCKLPLGLVALILSALVGLILVIDSIALNQISQALKRHPTEGGRLEKVDIWWVVGNIAVNGLTYRLGRMK